MVSTLVGGVRGDVVGPLAAARFGGPLRGLHFDPATNAIYVADHQNRKIKRIDLIAETVSTVAVTTANPSDVHVSPAGRLFWSQHASIWTLDESGAPVRFAGEGISQAAGLSSSFSICGGAGGELLALTNGVRRITADGAVLPYVEDQLRPSLIGSSDGPFGNARIYSDSASGGIARDALGSIYVAAGATVRKMVPEHVVRTLAGGEAGFQDGPGSIARFGNNVRGVAVDEVGRVYVTDALNRRIRLIVQKDWDADGIPDELEEAPPFMVGRDDGRVDSDGDSLSNATEFFFGTDPGDANSVFRATLAVDGSGARLSWFGREGVLYLVERSTDLHDWAPVFESISEGTDATMEWAESGPQEPGARVFYRVIPFPIDL